MEQYSFFKKRPLDIKGLMDDGYCPVCGYSFDEYGGELDLEQCPRCGTLVDWEMWHKLNDKEIKHERTGINNTCG